MVTRGLRITKAELDLKAVATRSKSLHSEQKLSLDVGSLAELKEGLDNGEEDRKQTEKLFSRIRQDVVQQFQWLRREQKKAERAQKTLLRDMKNANETLEKRKMACKMAKAAASEFEAQLTEDEAAESASAPDDAGSDVDDIANASLIPEDPEGARKIQKENNKKLKKLKTLVKKEELLLQAAEATVNSKSSLASIYEDFAVAADKGLALGSKLKDNLFETLTSCNLIRTRFNDLIRHQKEVVLGGLRHDYNRLSCLRLACTSIKDFNRLRNEVVPMCRVIEEKYRVEAELLQALHMKATQASALQAMTFRQIEGLIEAQRDNDLDLMSMFEQELASWKTIAFEGPRSKKGRAERDRVERTKKRRVEKETARVELASKFDGTIRKCAWDAFVADADGMVGRLAPPPQFRESAFIFSQVKENGHPDEIGDESENGTIGDKKTSDDGCTNNKSRGRDNSWEPRAMVDCFRTQYFRQKEIHFGDLVEEAHRVPSFAF